MTRKKSTLRIISEHASPGELYELSEIFLRWRADEHNLYNQVRLFTWKTRVGYVINVYIDLPVHQHFLLLPLMWLHHACLSQLFVHKTWNQVITFKILLFAYMYKTLIRSLNTKNWLQCINLDQFNATLSQKYGFRELQICPIQI